MAAKANVIGIIVQPGGTALIGRESTVADDGVAGINLRGYVTASFVQTANDSSANFHANSSGSNISSSKESYSETTGFNAGNYNLQLYNGSMDTVGVLKFKIKHSAADKKVMLADDDGMSDISFDTGTTSILDSNLLTGSAITIGSNAGSANTVVDVSASNYTIRCGQGINFYNGGTLLARASALRLGTSNSGDFAGENSSRYGINLSNGKIGGASTSAAPTGTWHVSSIKSASSSNILRFTTGTCTITGKNTSTNRFFEITDGNVYHSDGTITLDSGVAAEMQWDAASTDQDNGPYNFIINDASCTARIRTDLEVLNDLTVAAGTFNTHSNDGSADKNLTVTGQLTASGGALLLNNSTVSFGAVMAIGNAGTVTCADTNLTTHSFSLGQGPFTAPSASGSFIITNETSHLAFDYDGNQFIHNSGTIEIRTQATTLVDFTSNNGSTHINNVIINHADCVATLPSAGGIGGDLTITAGKFDCAGYDLSVGSVTIASGAEFKASSGTTTINGAGAGHSGQASALENQGTFTHNNGIILLSSAGDQDVEMDGTGNFYNLTINKTNNDVIMHPNVTIENNLDVTLAADHTLRPASTTNTVTVHGITSLTTGKIGGTTAYDGNHNWGTLQINSGTFTMGSGTNNVTSIRNKGGTIS